LQRFFEQVGKRFRHSVFLARRTGFQPQKQDRFSAAVVMTGTAVVAAWAAG
jgi:hypothetical protein